MNLSVALVQLDAGDDVERNLSAAVALADEAAAGGARLVGLPEYLQYRGGYAGYRASARPIPGPHAERFAEVARRRAAWIQVGGIAERSPDPQRAIKNGAYVLAPSQIGGPRGSPAYGRSLIIDPWGTVLAQAPARAGIIRAELDLDRVAVIRR